MPPKPTTYEDYLELMADSSGSKMQEETSSLIERFQNNQSMHPHFSPVTYLLDYTTRKYVYVQDTCFNMLGFRAGYFLERGLEEYLSRWHCNDYYIVNNYVQPFSMNFFKSVPVTKWTDHIISYNYRFLDAKGEYKTVLQRATYIPGGKDGLPLGMIGVIFDLTHFKTGLSMVHTIEEIKEYNNRRVNTILYKRVHPIHDLQENGSISSREREILKYISDGLGSKGIADKLGISIHTVNNHRKNVLAKTNCKSSAELINYAAKHGLLHK